MKTESGYLESLPDDRLVDLWQRRGAPAGALDRASVAMRGELLIRGLWRVVYGVRAERPCEGCAGESAAGSHEEDAPQSRGA